MKIHHVSLDNNSEETIASDLSAFDKGDYVVGSCVHEAHDWGLIYRSQFEPFMRLCRQNDLRYDIITNETYLDKNFRIPNYTPIIINFFALNTVYRIKHTNIKTNTRWNKDANKFLFLTGKADKINRVGLLSLLINLKLKKKMQWSFFPYMGTDIAIKSFEFYRMFTKGDWRKFCKKYERNLDNVAIEYTENGSHYSGFPFDVEIFKNTKFSIISESEFLDDTCVWQTEKTYKTIINKHPFIMAGQLGSIERLKEQGFRTFENYLLEPNYYKIEDPKKRIYSIAKNAKHWIENLDNNTQRIADDVEHNYQKLFDLHDDTVKQYNIFQNQEFYHEFFKSTLIK